MKTLLSICLLALPRLAAAAEEHHVAQEHGIPWTTLLFSTINVLIFGAVLKRFVWPAVRAWTVDRTRQVVATLAEAARAKDEAERLKSEWEARLTSLGRELEEMRGKARREIANERDQILAEARKEAEVIRADAQRAAAQHVREAEARLRQEFARSALEITQDMARREVTAADQERFVDEFLAKVGV